MHETEFGNQNLQSGQEPQHTKHMKIERLIRRMAGIIVLTGLALGYWVHPGWLLLTAFAGFNLLQSSFTGFCPAETILRKLGCGDEAKQPRS